MCVCYIISKFPALQQFKNAPKVPKLGTLYPAHPIPLGVLQSLKHKDMKDMYIKLFDLKSNAILAKPSKMPTLSENLRAKITKIAPLEKIVFYLPEANSMECLPYFVFKIECLQLQKQGYTIITNITKAPNYLKISGVIDLNLSMKEVVALALACKRVISMRSGFCDIIALNCKDLKVYYPNDESLKGSSLKVIDESVSAKEVVLMDLADFAEKINSLLPLKLYNRYIAKGFLKRLRTPFTAYFKIYKKHKANETQNEIKQNIMRDFGRNFGLNETEIETFSEIQSELESTYEYQLGRLLEKACKAFWRGGFLAFPFAYLKLRKQKKKLTRLNEILG